MQNVSSSSTKTLSPKSFFEELRRHKVIAWDHDETLVGWDGARTLQAWIEAHPEKQHHIVTFRKTADGLLEELPESTRKRIASVTCAAGINLEERLFDWKAKVCSQIGATVLVDDLYFQDVGCRQHGITFLNSHWSKKQDEFQ